MKLGFTVRIVLPVLFAAVLLLAWSGAADGKTGDLQIEVREGSARGEFRRFHVQYGHTLSSSDPFEHVFEDLEPGGYAIVAYLDVDSGESQTSGDAIHQAGPSPVTVVSDMLVPVAIERNAIQ